MSNLHHSIEFVVSIICLTDKALLSYRFVTVSPIYKPTDDGVQNQLFISESYDATSHFETTCLDVLDIYRRGTGEDFDFSKVKHNLGDEDM